jgi:hypothetical protein
MTGTLPWVAYCSYYWRYLAYLTDHETDILVVEEHRLLLDCKLGSTDAVHDHAHWKVWHHLCLHDYPVDLLGLGKEPQLMKKMIAVVDQLLLELPLLIEHHETLPVPLQKTSGMMIAVLTENKVVPFAVVAAAASSVDVVSESKSTASLQVVVAKVAMA